MYKLAQIRTPGNRISQTNRGDVSGQIWAGISLNYTTNIVVFRQTGSSPDRWNAHPGAGHKNRIGQQWIRLDD